MTEIRAICNLSDEEFTARRKELREGLMPLVRGREKLSDGLALFFDASTPIREELEAFVAFERECCPGLGFSVHDTPGALRLEIRGVDPNASLFAGAGAETGGASDAAAELGAEPGLFAQRETHERFGALRALRALRTLGIAGAVALLVCCVVPIGIAALVGAKLAAPLSALDNPWVIALGTVGFASLLWRRERVRASRARAAAGTGGCGC